MMATATARIAAAHTPARKDAPPLFHLAANALAATPVSWGTAPATYIGAMIIENGYTLMGGGGIAMSAWNDAPTAVSARCVAGATPSHANPREEPKMHRSGNPSSNAVAAYGMKARRRSGATTET